MSATAERLAIRRAASVSILTGAYGVAFGALAIAAGPLGAPDGRSGVQLASPLRPRSARTLLAGAAVCSATKVAGHLVPAHWLAPPRVTRIAGPVTIKPRAPFIVVVVLAALIAAARCALGW